MRHRRLMRTATWMLLTAAFTVTTSKQSFAVPAAPVPATLRQPDGQAIAVTLRGDERLHWHEDAKGYTILRPAPGAAWVYAARDAATGQLVPTPHGVGLVNPDTLGLAKRLLPATTPRLEAAKAEAAAAARPVPRSGTMKNLVILVAFQDKLFAHAKPEFEALFNQIGYTTDGAQGSVKDYYNEVSYGQLDVDSVVVEPIVLPNGYAYYGANDTWGNDMRPREMVQQALAALEARGFDFATMDGDNDGWVDGLTIIHAGGAEEYGGNDPDYIWSHQWQMLSTVTYDGKKMRTYHTEPERRGFDSSPSTWGLTRIGVICHENGHFLGLPDLYDYGYDSSGVGNFCLMAGGSWNGNLGSQPAQMSAWCKKMLGWVDPVVVPGFGTYTVPRVEDNPVVFQINGAFAPNEYFLIENKQAIGFDASLPGSQKGLLIWHVDESQGDNDNQLHYLVDLEEASGIQHLELNYNDGTDADYFRIGTMTAFSSATTPNNRSYGGGELGLNIVDVSAPGPSMTFSIGAVPPAGFTWDAITSPQTMGLPFPARLTARNRAGGVETNFTGSIGLSGYIGGYYAIGAGQAAWNYPLSTYFHDARAQVIYLQSEIGEQRSLTDLSLNVLKAPGQPMNRWTIRMKHTAMDKYPPLARWEGDWTTVYQADQVIDGTGWVKFAFTTPFEYNGASNLMVDFSFNNDANSSDGEVAVTPKLCDRTIAYRDDSVFGIQDPLAWTGIIAPTPSRSRNVPDIRISAPGSSVPISPETTGNFTDGVWNGEITVHAAAVGMYLRADDGEGHAGDSALFDVVELAGILPYGTPESWLAKYGLTDSPAAKELTDPDGDGFATWEEYQADTDPLNPASNLKITGIRMVPGGTRIEWRGGTAVAQVVERRVKLDDGSYGWQPIFTNPPPTQPTGSLVDPVAGPGARFYRVRAGR